MINIKLVDGSIRNFVDCNDYMIVARNISKSLAKKAIAVSVNGIIKDLSTKPNNGDVIEIITSDSNLGIDIIRHDTAHVLARAVKELYGSKVQVTIGPSTKDGFYYDFDYSNTFSLDDLEKIENRMRQIIDYNEKFERQVISKEEAIRYFTKIGEHYKADIVNSISDSEPLSIYKHGDFIDLCRGPHGPDTSFIKAFKLLKVAGSYWRGNSQNKMLQRIYGIAFDSEQKLKEYLVYLEEAERRDHRKIGKDMRLFHIQDEAVGTVFWHPKGCALFRKIISFIRKCQVNADYVEIFTPEIMDKSIWEKSGHWDKFAEQMYIASTINEEKIYAVRPMNCPGGVQIFKHDLVSYRQLPIRMAEFGKVYRFEPSGALHGLFRLRGFTQDDAHIYCTEEQMVKECVEMCKLLKKIYNAFGFTKIIIKFAGRPEKRIGSDEIWDKSESALKKSLQEMDVEYKLNPNEGAFYGPKLEFTLQDVLGRDWQMGTLQVDFNLPERFDISYIEKDGQKMRPVMLHRAILGSIERFIGILLEHYAGHLPLWLAPTQIVIINVNDKVLSYTKKLYQIALDHGISAILDIESETLNYKIRKYSLEKIPLIVIVGEKEAAQDLVSVRRFGASKVEIMKSNDFFVTLKKEVAEPEL